jgi:hypothetical protein
MRLEGRHLHFVCAGRSTAFDKDIQAGHDTAIFLMSLAVDSDHTVAVSWANLQPFHTGIDFLGRTGKQVGTIVTAPYWWKPGTRWLPTCIA